MKVLKILLIILLSPVIIALATTGIACILGVITTLNTELLIKVLIAVAVIMVIKKLISGKKEGNGKQWVD